MCVEMLRRSLSSLYAMYPSCRNFQSLYLSMYLYVINAYTQYRTRIKGKGQEEGYQRIRGPVPRKKWIRYLSKKTALQLSLPRHCRLLHLLLDVSLSTFFFNLTYCLPIPLFLFHHLSFCISHPLFLLDPPYR